MVPRLTIPAAVVQLGQQLFWHGALVPLLEERDPFWVCRASSVPGEVATLLHHRLPVQDQQHLLKYFPVQGRYFVSQRSPLGPRDLRLPTQPTFFIPTVFYSDIF